MPSSKALAAERTSKSALGEFSEEYSWFETSSNRFEWWVEVCPHRVTDSALLDRLVKQAQLVSIVGQSFRMKDLRNREKGDATPKN